MRQYLNLNNLILFATGLALMAWGGWTIYRTRQYLFGGGMFLIGFGNILFGITNGFTDQTPRGRFFFKVALFAYGFGLATVAYTMRHMIGLF